MLATWKNKRLKAKYVRKMKQDEARSPNRPNYKSTIWKHGDSETFVNIEEASSFWRELWEEEVSGKEDPDWLDEIKRAFYRCASPLTQEAWKLETAEAVKAKPKKRNWSVPGPDRLTNFCWKGACSLHELSGPLLNAGKTTRVQLVY